MRDHAAQPEKYAIPPPTPDLKTIVFDLDETLVHCNETEHNSDVVIAVTFPNGESVNAGINVRPHCLKILKALSKVCEVMVFTASHACYAS